MNPWIAERVAAEHTKDLHRHAATKRLARHSRPVPRFRPLRQFIAIVRTASPRPAQPASPAATAPSTGS